MFFSIISSSLFWGFVLTCVIIELTPGPNMVYLAILSATEGRRAGLAATIGVALGLFIVGIAAALGLAAVIAGSDVLYQALRWTGILFLLWLAYDTWSESAEQLDDEHGGPRVSLFGYFNRGLLTNLLNPKAGLFYVAVLPGFVDPSLHVVGQLIFLSVVYVAVATSIHLTIVALAGSAQLLLQDPGRNRFVRRVLALVLVGVVIWFWWSTLVHPL